MNLRKAAVLTIGAVGIAGIITLQFRSARRPEPGTVIAPGTAAPAAPEPAPPVPLAPATGQSPAAPIASAPNSISIPPNGWGRNPFMTIEEIATMNHTDEPPVAIVAPEPIQPAALPELALSGIISNRDGFVAIIDSRVVRVGDRVGSETIKEIKSGSVVLESGGNTREIMLKSTGVDVRPSVPRRELQ